MTTAFKSQFTSIKGLSDRRRLPRLGKVRLGFKATKGNDAFYPVELPFFMLPREVGAIYGFKSAEAALERATALGCTRQLVLNFIRDNYMLLSEDLEIMFPVNDRDIVFPNAYKWYGSQSGVKCMGNGEVARRHESDVDATVTVIQPEEKGMVLVECPCSRLKTDENPKGDCTQRGHLLVMIPKVNMGGVYQIDVSSYNSIIDINSGIEYTAALTGGRFCLVPLQLRRKPTETHHDGKKQVHYTLQILCNVPADSLNLLREGSQRVITQQSAFVLPPPEDVSPLADEGPVVMTEEESAPIEGAVVESGAHAEPTKKEIAEDFLKNADSLKALQEAWKAVDRMHKNGEIGAEDYSALARIKDERKSKL